MLLRPEAAKRFCLYSNVPGSFSCNNIWVDTLLICVTKVPAKHLILFTQRYSYRCAGKKFGLPVGASNQGRSQEFVLGGYKF